MPDHAVNEFEPDVVSPPGDTLLEALEERGMTQLDLARRTGRDKKTLNEIIKGKAPVTEDTALQLERALNIPARFWNNLERNYREHLARMSEKERLSRQVQWLKSLPVSQMIKMGWVMRFSDKVDQLREVLNFFGVASPEQWEKVRLIEEAAFRRSSKFKADPGALTAWLRRGETLAQGIECGEFSKSELRDRLPQMRSLTREDPSVFEPELKRLCAEAGVAVVFVPQLPKCRASGAARWLSPVKALIQLSLRYRTDDHLWFSFFHEVGHILLHSKKNVFLDDGPASGAIEEEANTFAADILIPPSDFQELCRVCRPPISGDSVKRFAKRIGISPGIVVGRLQHEKILPQTHLHKLKRRLEWRTDAS